MGPQGLFAYAPDLEALAARSVEGNPFYELPFLESALRNLRGDAEVELVLVFTPDRNPQRPARLSGFFPVEHVPLFPGLPMRMLRLWRHRYCFLTAPLVDAESAEDVLDRFFAWAAARAPLVEMHVWPAEGPLDRALATVVRRREAAFFVRQRWLRARLNPAADAATCLEEISLQSRKKFRRQEKLLSDQGAIEFQALGPGEDVEPWLGQFLALECSSLTSRATDGAFFLDAARAAHRVSRLEMVRMSVGGRVISSKCNVRSAAGASFAFKNATDESFSRFSPGELLELENVRHAHRPGGPAWMDSCAEPDHPMLDLVWSGRRFLQSLVVSTGARGGDAAVSLLPLLDWLKRVFRRRS